MEKVCQCFRSKPEIKLRRERAHQLGENPRRSHQGLLQALRLRANDAAQTRPEYGLANNAAFFDGAKRTRP